MYKPWERKPQPETVVQPKQLMYRFQVTCTSMDLLIVYVWVLTEQSTAKTFLLREVLSSSVISYSRRNTVNPTITIKVPRKEDLFLCPCMTRNRCYNNHILWGKVDLNKTPIRSTDFAGQGVWRLPTNICMTKCSYDTLVIRASLRSALHPWMYDQLRMTIKIPTCITPHRVSYNYHYVK